MSQLRIAAIVEGDGEVTAVPILIRRFADLLGMSGRVQVHPVIRQPASRLMRPGELERHVELAARKLDGPGGIFVLLDSEDDCPATLGPMLLRRIREARPDLPTALVLAHREYEAWFLASASSIAGLRGLPSELMDHPSPETVRGCKEWISRQLPRGQGYSECSDQTALTALFDMTLAHDNSRSFEKCWREIKTLLQATARITPGFES